MPIARTTAITRTHRCFRHDSPLLRNVRAIPCVAPPMPHHGILFSYFSPLRNTLYSTLKTFGEGNDEVNVKTNVEANDEASVEAMST